MSQQAIEVRGVDAVRAAAEVEQRLFALKATLAEAIVALREVSGSIEHPTVRTDEFLAGTLEALAEGCTVLATDCRTLAKLLAAPGSVES